MYENAPSTRRKERADFRSRSGTVEAIGGPNELFTAQVDESNEDARARRGTAQRESSTCKCRPSCGRGPRDTHGQRSAVRIVQR